MSIRERIEEQELNTLSDNAAFAKRSLGREYGDIPDDYRTCFQRDRDRIIHCKSFRRLKHKTQVFFSPEGDHYRTRLTHTLEVSQISRTISRALRLNEDLTEAIALGHDLGHTPFGHAGENGLRLVVPGGFNHNVQSLRVVEVIERRSGSSNPGLNLTKEVRDGILCHSFSWKDMPITLEGQVVRLADKIAYVNHDIDDAIRAKLLTEDDIPKQVCQVLGTYQKDRLNTLVKDAINNSENKQVIDLSEDVKAAMLQLRAFMFDNVYTCPSVKVQADRACNLVKNLYQYYLENFDMVMKHIDLSGANVDKSLYVVDYIAGMTDRFAVNEWTKLFVPKPWEL